MLKHKSRFLSLILCLVFAFTMASGLIGCKRPQEEMEKLDTTKTQLFIGAYGGGYGTAYLEDLKARFEEYTAEMSFEEGKTGVQVIIRPDQEKYTANNMTTNILYDNCELFHLSGSELSKFIAGSTPLVEDITDVVKADLGEFGDPAGTTIESKLGQAHIDYLNRGGKYYELPFVDTSLGVVFNQEVYEENALYIKKGCSPSEKMLEHYNEYIANGGTPENYVAPDINTLWNYDEESDDADFYSWTGDPAQRSAGPDGKYETEHDNGLPATLEDFEAFLVRAKQRSVSSIIWTEQNGDTYTAFMPRSFYVNYHGPIEASITQTGGGAGVETSVIKSFDTNGNPVISTESISVINDNLDMLAKQAGHYYAIDMFEKIIRSNTISSKTWLDLSHIEAQANFIISNKLGNQPIAMLIEGSWWENEAESAGTYKDYEGEFTKNERRFGWYSMPEATMGDFVKRLTGEKRSTIMGDGSSCVMKAGLPEYKKDVAKLFLKFANTNESLRRFTIITSMPAPYEYELQEEDYAQMTPFAKSYIQCYLNSDILPGTSLDIAKQNSDLVAITPSLNYYKAMKPDNGGDYEIIVPELLQNNTSARTYFEGMYYRLLFDLGEAA